MILFENQKQVQYETEGVFDDALLREARQRQQERILKEIYGDDLYN